MRARNLLLMIPLGVALALLPAMASSETTPSVEAVAHGPVGSMAPMYAWSPTQSTVCGRAAASVLHGLHRCSAWRRLDQLRQAHLQPAPFRSGENNFGEHWSGSCTFTQPGTYTFHCFGASQWK